MTLVKLYKLVKIIAYLVSTLVSDRPRIGNAIKVARAKRTKSHLWDQCQLNFGAYQRHKQDLVFFQLNYARIRHSLGAIRKI